MMREQFEISDPDNGADSLILRRCIMTLALAFPAVSALGPRGMRSDSETVQ